jgi:CRISPR-associated protein (TIGR02584 family)
VPDEIIVITTASGKAKIENDLFGKGATGGTSGKVGKNAKNGKGGENGKGSEGGIWQQLRIAILGEGAVDGTDTRLDFSPETSIRLVRRKGAAKPPLDVLNEPEDHHAFADAIMHELWAFTSQPDTRVIGSLAGGFKTMSALMLSAMQLLANPGDRLTHVLVTGGFDNPKLTPQFFFPLQSEQNLTTDAAITAPAPAGKNKNGKNEKNAKNGKIVLRAADAAKSIKLIDLPLIPLRRWFADALDAKPPSYKELVERSVKEIVERVEDLTLEVGPVQLPQMGDKHWFKLNGTTHELSIEQFAYLRFSAERAKRGEKPFKRPADFVEELADWVKNAVKTEPRFSNMAEKADKITADNLTKRIAELRSKIENLKTGSGGKALSKLLPKRDAWGLALARENITLN